MWATSVLQATGQSKQSPIGRKIRPIWSPCLQSTLTTLRFGLVFGTEMTFSNRGIYKLKSSLQTIQCSIVRQFLGSQILAKFWPNFGRIEDF
jgi:hypothetical protein